MEQEHQAQVAGLISGAWQGLYFARASLGRVRRREGQYASPWHSTANLVEWALYWAESGLDWRRHLAAACRLAVQDGVAEVV